MDDIIDTIRENEAVGNLSSIDSINLIDLTTKLYMQIYSKYKEMEDFTMRLYDQSMELAGDKYEKSVEELEDEVKEMKDIIEAKDASLKAKDANLKAQALRIEELERQLKAAQKEA